MAFTGRVYWVSGGQDVIACWDATTSSMFWVSAYQPDLFGGSYASDYGFFGTLTVLGDGRILSRLGDNNGDQWGVTFDADLSAASASYWSATQNGNTAVASDAATGVYDPDTGLNWMYRADHDDRFDSGNWWLGYDNSGTLVDSRAYYDNSWFFSWPSGPGSIGNAVLLDHNLYRSIDDFNNIDKFSLSTGAWERANGFSTGHTRNLAPVGVYQGQVVWSTYQSLTPTVLQTIDDSSPWVGMSSGSFNINLGDRTVFDTWHPAGMSSSAGSGVVRISDPDAIYIEDNHDSTYTIHNLDLGTDTVSDLHTFPETFLLQDGTTTDGDGPYWTSIFGEGFGMVLTATADTPRVSPLLRHPRADGRGLGPSRHVPGAALRHVGNF